MSSFKLDNSKDMHQQLIQGGAFLLILALPIALLIWFALGALLAVVGIALMVAGRYAA